MPAQDPVYSRGHLVGRLLEHWMLALELITYKVNNPVRHFWTSSLCFFLHHEQARRWRM